MKVPAAKEVRRRSQVRLQLFAEGRRRNPKYLQFYDIESRIRQHERTGGQNKRNRPREEKLIQEAWAVLQQTSLITKAARELGNPLTGQLHLVKQYMSAARQQGFHLRFSVNPCDPVMAWSSAPDEVGAAVTLDGKTVPGLIHMMFPDEDEIPNGQAMIIDLVSNRFLVSYDVDDWGLLSAKEKSHCVCLDLNLKYPNMGDLLADFRFLLPSIKERLKQKASNGQNVRLQTNNALIAKFKAAVIPKFPKKRIRYSGNEIVRWFEAYDLNTWGMRFEDALKTWGYQKTALPVPGAGLSIPKITQKLFPRQWKLASERAMSEDSSPEFRELMRKYSGPPYNQSWPDAEKRAAAELNLDLRPPSAKAKKLIQRTKQYIENARTWIWMPYEHDDSPSCRTKKTDPLKIF